MINITPSEVKLLLKIFKDFSHNYNANSISKETSITSRGALKMLKKLSSQNILISKQLGKAVFYKINFENNYALKLIETLLIAESKEKAERWINELEEVFRHTESVILFGSIIKNEKKAREIDVILVLNKKKYKEISNFIERKNKILFKKIHEIPQTINDLKENLQKNNKALIDAIKEGYLLHGQDKIIKVIKNVTSF